MVGRSGELKGIVAVEDILHFLSRELGELAQVFPLQRKIETKRRLRIA